MEDVIKEHQRGSKVFQRRGNQQQYDHAKECMATLEQIDKHLDRSDVAKAKRSLENGKVLLNKRIKLIRIADREGWGTVTEYLTDDLASDSADEKHLQKAIKAAAAKQERTRKSFTAPSSKFRTSWPSFLNDISFLSLSICKTVTTTSQSRPDIANILALPGTPTVPRNTSNF